MIRRTASFLAIALVLFFSPPSILAETEKSGHGLTLAEMVSDLDGKTGGNVQALFPGAAGETDNLSAAAYLLLKTGISGTPSTPATGAHLLRVVRSMDPKFAEAIEPHIGEDPKAV